MASPELLQLVENCPTGAETLIARILNIITDKGNEMFGFNLSSQYPQIRETYLSDILP